MLEKYSYLIFSDGSSLGNPGNGGFGTIVIQNQRLVTEIGGHEKNTTNNRMELAGLLSGLRMIEKLEGDVLCCTDSQYVINSVTKWLNGWKKNNWKTSTKTPVLNKDLIEQIDRIIEAHKKIGEINFKYVPGHVGVSGNERCDQIATTFARDENPDLFSGTLSDYAIDILNIGVDEDKNDKKFELKKKNGKAYSYLSLVDGKAMRHDSWPECEKRVKGKSGVKYKKALSQQDEQTILKSWGVRL